MASVLITTTTKQQLEEHQRKIQRVRRWYEEDLRTAEVRLRKEEGRWWPSHMRVLVYRFDVEKLTELCALLYSYELAIHRELEELKPNSNDKSKNGPGGLNTVGLY